MAEKKKKKISPQELQKLIKENYEKEIVSLEEELDELYEKLEKEKEQVASLQDFETKNKELKEEVKKMNEHLEAKEKELEEVKTSTSLIEESDVTQIEDLKKEFSMKEGQLNEKATLLASEKEALEKEISRLRAEQSRSFTSSNSDGVDIRLEKENITLQQELVKLRSELNLKDDMVQTNIRELAELKEQLNNKEEQNNLSNDVEVSYIKQERQRYLDTISDLNAEISRLSEAKAEMISQVDYSKLKADYTKLQESFITLEKDNSMKYRKDFTEALINYETQITSLQNEIKTKDEMVSKLINERDVLYTELDVAKKNLSSMSKEDIADVLISAKIQAKQIKNRAEEEANTIVSKAGDRLAFLQEEGDNLYKQIQLLAVQNNDFLLNLKEKAEELKSSEG